MPHSHPTISPEFIEEVCTLYQDVENDLESYGPRCELSGRCCRFQEYGHDLFLSRVEAEILLHEGLPNDEKPSAEGCPFQRQGLCTAREKRPLGCRIYFCDPGFQEVMPKLAEQYTTRLKQLHERNQLPWEYKPLVAFLMERYNERV